ncbi:MAG TPA: tetraacyldisaccharide 4'-kinase [Edaphobacter sp.]|nr:tetraacyldisaccharide 4'-kinase [Edaphobacter sp.]
MNLRRPLLLPLVPVYGAALAAKKQMFQLGWLKQNRLTHPVISVGSVSAGGAGKTPVVLMLAGILRRRGYAVRILTRGYGRTSEFIERVEPYDDAVVHGDEPVLLAQRSGVPVFAGADRYRAGVYAEKDEEAEKIVVHLLDDGFQHRQLARDVDIVLLTEEDVQDTLLPAGNLREPLSMLREADVIVLRTEEAAGLREFIAKLMAGREAPAIWEIRRRLSMGEAGEVALPSLPLAFCGIARPESFTQMLNAEGCMPVTRVDFPDHHKYDDHDVATLLERGRQSGANGFVTTEKDAVKLTPVMIERLEDVGPVVVTRLSAELIDEAGAMRQLLSRVERLDRRRR